MTADIANHLWQSTLFAVAAGLLTVALRKAQARIRYWLWFSASAKFFVPFSLLITFGSNLAWAPAARQITPPAVSSAMGQISQPFADLSLMAEPAAPSTPGSAGPFTVAMLAPLWMSGAMAIALIRFRLWRGVRAIVRSSTRRDDAGAFAGVAVRSAPGLMEPGVVGWWRPVLLLPLGIEDHLTPRQLDAVVAHELCHVRRRDNLTSTIHMVVETVFWFHPLVWWIGARLIEERERACDEEVLRLGGDPRTYAEGIVNVCKRYAEAPLVCVSGVSGANLRKRIEAIMMNRVGRKLNAAAKAALAAAAVTILTLPVVVGAIVVPSAQEAIERFEVATIKPNKTPIEGSGMFARGTMRFLPSRFEGTQLTLQELVMVAYDLQAFEIVGGPAWATSDRFDIAATMQPPPTGFGPLDWPSRNGRLLRGLLEERFKIVVHEEHREMPVYSLVMARSDRKLGTQLRPFEGECTDDPGKVGPVPERATFPMPISKGPQRCMSFSGMGRITSRGMLLSDLTRIVSPFPAVRRRVIDRTGLTGRFDLDLEWTPLAFAPSSSRVPDDRPSDAGPTIFIAVQEQLGLKLESGRDAVRVLVIDSVNQPSQD